MPDPVASVAPKSIFTSKTFWFNLLALLAQTLPVIAQYIPQPYGILATGIGNLILRVATDTPVSLTGK